MMMKCINTIITMYLLNFQAFLSNEYNNIIFEHKYFLDIYRKKIVKININTNNVKRVKIFITTINKCLEIRKYSILLVYIF